MTTDSHSPDRFRVLTWLLVFVVLVLMLGGLGYALYFLWAPSLTESDKVVETKLAPQATSVAPAAAVSETALPAEVSSEKAKTERPPLLAEEADDHSADAEAAKAIVNRAYDFFLEKQGDMNAVQEGFRNNPELRNDERGLYIFMHSFDKAKKEAICIGQGIRPELIGKNMWGLRTPNGRHLFPDFIDLAETRDSFWSEYEWLNPYTKTIQIKRSYMRIVHMPDGRTAWIGCGFWKE